MRSKPVRKLNFSLIELIVVVSIIAILLTMIQPALTKTLKRSENVTCMNNLKQMGVVSLTYVEDYDGRLAPRSWNGVQGLWMAKLESTWSGKEISLNKFNPLDSIFECPTANKRETTLAIRYQGGYGYNGQAGDFRYSNDVGLQDFTRNFTVIMDPSKTTLIGDDKEFEPGGPGYLNSQLLSYHWAKNHPRVRHDYFANYFWADGHVERIFWDDFYDHPNSKGGADYYLKFNK